MIIRIALPLALYTVTALTIIGGYFVSFDTAHQLQTLKGEMEQTRHLAEINRPVTQRNAVMAVLARRAATLPFRVRREVADAVVRAAIRYDLDPMLLLAVIETESSYRPDAVSDKGAVGLMQVRPFVAAGLSHEMRVSSAQAERLTDHGVNVAIGAYYLSKLLRRFDGNLTLALEAYNRGPTRLTEWLDHGGKVKGAYTRKVMKARRDIVRTAGSRI